MKPFILLFSVLFISLNFNCKKEEPKCVFDHIVPSKFKDYVPYKDGDQVVFQATTGQLDTLIVSEIKFDSYPGSRHDCPNVYEKVDCKMAINWLDSTIMQQFLTIHLFDNVVTPNTILIRADGEGAAYFQATNFGGSGAGPADIILYPSFEINGISYPDVLLATCRNPIECSFIDSLCFVKNQGLKFYTIYGEGRMKI